MEIPASSPALGPGEQAPTRRRGRPPKTLLDLFMLGYHQPRGCSKSGGMTGNGRPCWICSALAIISRWYW